ncbi:MAG TPA: zf-HC2 domain-containing protein [Acetivibrio clariflavus]|nr:zf-HC2 domain-containing protein [Acetivibrio clariflavus]
MKNCEEILELLSLYIDNELDDATAKAVEKHIELCSSCKTELEQLREIIKMCNELDEVELPEDFNEVLHEKLKLEQKNMNENKKIIYMRNSLMRTVASVAAIFILIFAVRGFMYKGITTKNTNSSGTEIEPTGDVVYNTDIKAFDKEKDDVLSIEAADETQMYTYEMSEEIVRSAELYNSDETDSQNNSNENKFNVESDKNVSAASGATSTADQKNAPDETVMFKFSDGTETSDGTYLLAMQFGEELEVPVIGLTAYSSDFETDILKINEIAGKFGTKIKEDDTNASGSNMAKDLLVGGNPEFTLTNKADYVVSYSMDKLNYDKFIKEIKDKYKGKYYIVNNEEELNKRLKDVEGRIIELENSKKTNTDEYKSLMQEKENILNQLNSINSSSKIRVNITIVDN